MADQSTIASFVLKRSYAELALFAFVVRLIYLVIYRVYFHPLRSYPGPKLAAITQFYQAYYDIWLDGAFTQHMEELHEIYGPVIRVRPNELHFNNPETYFAIYQSYGKFTKDPAWYDGFDAQECLFGYIDPQDHKKRREILQPLFSRRAILKLEGLVQEKVDVLIDRLLGGYTKSPANVSKAFKAVTMDIIATYCYAHSFEGLAAPGFAHSIINSIESVTPLASIAKHFPILNRLNKLPPLVVKSLNPSIGGVVQLRHFLSTQIDDVLKNPDSLQSKDHDTIYHRLITPELIKSGKVPSKNSLLQEAQAFLVAGTDTTSNAMAIGFFRILENITVLKTLQAELDAAWPDKELPFTYEMAEKLPYLTGVIKESLRFSVGTLVPLPRVVVVPVEIEGKVLPPGVVVGAGPTFVLHNPTIFPEPHSFRPERWIEDESRALDKYLIVFSKGPRSCIGINLAWCELYLVFANMFRKLDLELYQTTKEDMTFRYHAVPVFRGRPFQALVRERM